MSEFEGITGKVSKNLSSKDVTLPCVVMYVGNVEPSKLLRIAGLRNSKISGESIAVYMGIKDNPDAKKILLGYLPKIPLLEYIEGCLGNAYDMKFTLISTNEETGEFIVFENDMVIADLSLRKKLEVQAVLIKEYMLNELVAVNTKI